MTALIAHRSFLHSVLDRQRARRQAIDPSYPFPSAPLVTPVPSSSGHPNDEIFKSGASSKSNVINYVPEEETIRNDYEEWYGQSGNFGSNYILGVGEDEVCEEYPALRKLMDLKAGLVSDIAHPPLFLHLSSASPTDIQASLQPARFDVILITPPLSMSWDGILALPIRNISADPGFVFLWCGRGDQEGLEKGRECFAKWGFRRAEDIVWVKTNRKDHSESIEHTEENQGAMHDHSGSTGDLPSTSKVGAGLGGLFASQKEHCLMGIRGTVRRSVDTRFVHCNVDTDVLVWEDRGEMNGSRHQPYLYTLIENFCLGTRRLHLFGPSHSPRKGWVTASTSLPLPAWPIPSEPHATSLQPFDPAIYQSLLPEKSEGRHVLPHHPEIETLRPKSPTRKGRGGAPTGPSGQTGGVGRPGPSHNSFRPPGQTGPHLQPQGPYANGADGFMPHAGQMGMSGMNGMMPMQMQMQVPMPMQMQMGWNPGQGQMGTPYDPLQNGMMMGGGGMGMGMLGWNPNMPQMGVGMDFMGGGGVDPQMMFLMAQAQAQAQAQQQGWHSQRHQGAYGNWQGPPGGWQ